MREENEKNENDFLKETDDILSFMQDYSEDEKKNNEISDGDASYYDDPNQDTEMEDTDDDLLALLDMISAQEEGNSSADKDEEISNNLDESIPEPTDVSNVKMEDTSIESSSFDDDLMAINDLLGDDAVHLEDSYSEEEKSNTPNDFGGIFSDVLSAVDSLNDKPDNSSDDSSISENTRKEPRKREPFKPEITESDSNAENQKNDKKIGFFQKLFGKKDSKKNSEAESNNGIETDTKKTAEDTKKTEASKKKEEKKEAVKKAAEKKKADKLAKQKNKKAAGNSSEENSPAKKKEAKKKKDVKKKPAAKKVKKVKKEKAVEAAEVVDVDDNIKLNKVAVIFVMTFFILIGGIVIIGTDLYSYSLSIKNANVAFSRQRYTEAYNDIYGLDIRKKDSKIYEKIMTVMYVNKELTSYENYYDMKKYPDALDSLLKGLERYDLYIDRASELGIEKDMGNVRKLILKELKNKFNLSEKEAIALNKTEDQTQYSINVINTALEKK